MLYFFTAFIIFIVFLAFQHDKRTSVKYLIGTVLTYAFALLFMILYLSQDVRYYNIIENYFLLPKSVWKTMMFLPVSKNTILRFMNLFGLLTILLGCRFSMSYQNPGKEYLKKYFFLGLYIVLALEYLLYDPSISKLLYLFFYPNLLDSGQYTAFMKVLHVITLCINHALVIVSILNLLRMNRQIFAFPHFKYYTYGETLSYILIMISYLILFGQLPDHMIRFSRVSGYTSYESLTLYSNPMLYTIFPYYLFCSAVLMCICVIALANISKKMNQKDFTISGQIDAVNTSSKAFCHYMKNELLALEAEAQLLEVPEESREDLKHIVERCQNLYGRLDKLHRSTKLARLTMENTDLEQLVREMVERMSPEFKGYQVQIQSVGHIPAAMVDPNYFEQALHNIVTNALDAMKNLPKERKQLHFTLRSVDNWIALSITDTGTGIPSENIPHIFEPFFTSQPIAEHWGIGMTMTYQIVIAHNGKITAESKEGQGTTFRILLPNLKKMLP